MKEIVSTLRDRLVGPGRMGAQKQEALPSRPGPAHSERPYWDGHSAVFLPPPGIFAEVLRCSKNPDLIEASERKHLREIQAQIDRLNREIHQLSVDGIRTAARSARARLAKGHGTRADAEFDAQNLIAGRKAMKRQRQEKIESARATLVLIAQRIEQCGRQVLPQVEAEANRLGIAPFHVPLVRGVAAACWTPSLCAATTIIPPRAFLRQIAIRL